MIVRNALLCGLAAVTAGCGAAGSNNAAPSAPVNAQGAVPPAASAAPAASPFAEFDRVCTALADPAATNAAAVAAGWEAFTPDPQTTLGQLLALAGRISGETPEAGALVNTAYRKAGTGGGEINLVISTMTGGPVEAIECRVYDFAAAAAPAEEAIAAWTSTRPTGRVAQQGVTSWTWEPAFRAGIDEISVVHVASDSPLRQQMPVIGLGITASKSRPGAAAAAPAATTESETN